MVDIDRCVTHPFERADNLCGRCGNAYCRDCLVQPWPRRPPFCKGCAMAAAGIRSTAAIAPVRTKREIKAFARERQRAERETKPTATGDGFPSRQPAIAANPFPAERGAVPVPQAGFSVPARTKRMWRPAS